MQIKHHIGTGYKCNWFTIVDGAGMVLHEVYYNKGDRKGRDRAEAEAKSW